jgi:hypothetical protein
MIVCLSVRRIHFEADEQRLQDQVYEVFQDEVYKDFKTKYMRTQIFSFQCNEASVLEHIAPINFPVYYVVVVLYVCVNECAPMIGLTRLAYPSLKPQSCWVVVIGLELLSLA